jgi:hypothetical protein
MSAKTLTGAFVVFTLAKAAFPLAAVAAAHTCCRRRSGANGPELTGRDSASVWQNRTVGGLQRVEEFLDRLENGGVRERDVRILDESTFLVRWR